jgi:hypothetical protein
MLSREKNQRLDEKTQFLFDLQDMPLNLVAKAQNPPPVPAAKKLKKLTQTFNDKPPIPGYSARRSGIRSALSSCEPVPQESFGHFLLSCAIRREARAGLRR